MKFIVFTMQKKSLVYIIKINKKCKISSSICKGRDGVIPIVDVVSMVNIGRYGLFKKKLLII